MSGTSTVLGPEDDNYVSPLPWLPNTVFGAGGNDTLRGEGANDYLSGDDGNDSLLGGNDNDTALGGIGNDTLAGDGGDDLLLGGDGNDLLLAGGGNDSLGGGAGNDTLYGGGYGNATLVGADGDDFLVSGASGDQIMFGGAGNDTFGGFSNNSVKYISGGGGTDRVIIPEVFKPGFLTTYATAQSMPGTGLPYYASYLTDTGYRFYLTDPLTLQFIDVNVPLNLPCFAEGTRIMTTDGERAVETLHAGALVVTAGGHGAPIKPVRWVGRSEVDLDAHPRPEMVAPVLVMPGALGEGVPHRPLRVSPDHALLVEGALIPARLLVNGETIRQLAARGRVTYFHVELEAHDILLSEGAPSESYLDLGNRSAFENAGVVQMLHADFAPKREGGMKRVTEGPALEKAHLAIARRAAEAGQDRRAAG